MDEIFGRAKLLSLAKEGWLRPSIKCRAASLAGADGVVGSSHRLSVVESTTPAAPSKEREHFLDGVSSPPWPRRGVSLAQKSRQKNQKCLCGSLRHRDVLVYRLPFIVIFRMADPVGTGDRLRGLISLEPQIQFLMRFCAIFLSKTAVTEHQVVMSLQIL